MPYSFENLLIHDKIRHIGAVMKEKELIEEMYNTAVGLLKKNADYLEKSERSMVACVLAGKSGKFYTGLNVAWFHSICAEPVALSNAIQNGEREFTHLISVKLRKSTGELLVISSCGICREMFNQLGHKDLKVILQTPKGKFFTETISELLPN